MSTPTYVSGSVVSTTLDPSHTVSAATFTITLTAGDLICVAVGWNSDTIDISGIADTQGNTYTRAVKVVSSGNGTQSIYYAPNIAGGAANVVTVTWASAIVSSDIRIEAIHGAATVGPLNVAGGQAGSISGGGTIDSGNVTTTVANCILIGAAQVQNDGYTAGTGYTARIRDSFDQTIEDKGVTATGSYNATITNVFGGGWYAMAIAAFGDTTTGASAVAGNGSISVTSAATVVGAGVAIAPTTISVTSTNAPKGAGAVVEAGSITVTSAVTTAGAGVVAGNASMSLSGSIAASTAGNANISVTASATVTSGAGVVAGTGPITLADASTPVGGAGVVAGTGAISVTGASTVAGAGKVAGSGTSTVTGAVGVVGGAGVAAGTGPITLVTNARTAAVYPIVPSADGYSWVDASGKPWLRKGMSLWAGPNTLTRTEWQAYFAHLKGQGINSVLVRFLETDATNSPLNTNGDAPFTGTLSGGRPDYTTPNTPFWSHIHDFVVDALAYDIDVQGAIAYSGYDGADSDGQNNNTVANGTTRCQTFGAFIGNLFLDCPNITIILLGDFSPVQPSATLSCYEAMDTGIQSAGTYRQTAHGSQDGTNHALDPWGVKASDFPTLRRTHNACYTWNALAGKPTNGQGASYALIDDSQAAAAEIAEVIEDLYNLNTSNGGSTLRSRCEQWQAKCGPRRPAAGHTIGNEGLWGAKADQTKLPSQAQSHGAWTTHWDDPDVLSFIICNNFFEARPWPTFRSDPSLVTSAKGTFKTNTYTSPTRTTNQRYAAIFCPDGRSVANPTVDLSRMAGTMDAYWLDPVDGSITTIGTFAASGTHTFTAPSTNADGATDFVLVLDVQEAAGGSISLTANDTVIGGAGVVAGAGSISVTGTAAPKGAGVAIGAGATAVTASANVVGGAGVAAGTGAITLTGAIVPGTKADGTVTLSGTAVVAGVGAAVGAGASSVTGAASVAGVGAAVGAGSLTVAGSANAVGGAAVVLPGADPIISASANITGAGVVVCSASIGVSASASISSGSGATASIGVTATCTIIPGTGVVAASSAVSITAVATIGTTTGGNASGSMTATCSVVAAPGVVSLPASLSAFANLSPIGSGGIAELPALFGLSGSARALFATPPFAPQFAKPSTLIDVIAQVRSSFDALGTFIPFMVGRYYLKSSTGTGPRVLFVPEEGAGKIGPPLEMGNACSISHSCDVYIRAEETGDDITRFRLAYDLSDTVIDLIQTAATSCITWGEYHDNSPMDTDALGAEIKLTFIYKRDLPHDSGRWGLRPAPVSTDLQSPAPPPGVPGDGVIMDPEVSPQ